MDEFDLSGAELPEFDDADLLMPHERELRDALMQVIATLQEQNALLVEIARRLGPKRLLRDEQQRIVGVAPAE